MPRTQLLLLCIMLVLTGSAYSAGNPVTDAEIRQQMIQESIASYSGNCPCPYNLARNGSRCGKRSAWSRPGGASPLCFDTDISDEMVERYKARVQGRTR